MLPSEQAARNSWLRERTAGSITWVTEKLHETFPHLTADHVTLLGLVGTTMAAALTLFRDDHSSSQNTTLTTSSLGLMVASQLTDVVDGSLARFRAKLYPDQVNPNGQLVDVTSDRLQEMVLAFTRVIAADQRSDAPGEWAALGSLVTSPLPSLTRANAESKGFIVSESGHGALEFLGTRAGRAILAILATEFPVVKNVPVQTIADMLTTTANIITTSKRLSATRKEHTQPASPEIIKKAQTRKKVLAGIAGASAILAGGYIVLQKKK